MSTTSTAPRRTLVSGAMKLLRRPFAGPRSATSPMPTTPVEPFGFTALPQPLASRLDQIPSETTRGERQFLYRYFRNFWSGTSDAVEIGPFLGGTSRAIALGMLHNPRRRAGTRLLTFDRFRDYYDVPRLIQMLRPMINSGALAEGDFTGLGERAPFLEIFRRIHADQDYADCLLPSDHGVPDLPEQESTGSWMRLPEGFRTDAVFVDGCKSWYGTKYFMRTMAPAVEPGATFLFQDFGWYTCFWLAAFIKAFGETFEAIGSVDNTYVFQLTRPLTTEQIDATFSDSPEQVGAAKLGEWFKELIAEARERGDRTTVIRHTLHQGAALCYVGDLQGARDVLTRAETLPGIEPFRGILENAWKVPTYSPHGSIELGR